MLGNPECGQTNTVSAKTPLKLNLGSGQNPFQGYINVDKFGTPDVHWDLEQFPWPWEENSVSEVILNHVLEHLGSTTETYFGIIRELYRICAPGAVIRINVPHPRHDDFMTDPTHVRPVTPGQLEMFSKRMNHLWKAESKANSPLALYLDVDFEVENVEYKFDPYWDEKFPPTSDGEIPEELSFAMTHYNNVIKEIWMDLRVIKPAGVTGSPP